jgi:hypothetical protein
MPNHTGKDLPVPTAEKLAEVVVVIKILI